MRGLILQSGPLTFRPLYAHSAASAAYFNADRTFGGIQRQRHRRKALATLECPARRRSPYCNRPSATLGLINPTMQHGRVEPPCQAYRCDRHAGLLARAYRFGLEMCAMGSTTPVTGLDHLFRSIHVHAYLLS
jgi:hypothetical protein